MADDDIQRAIFGASDDEEDGFAPDTQPGTQPGTGLEDSVEDFNADYGGAENEDDEVDAAGAPPRGSQRRVGPPQLLDAPMFTMPSGKLRVVKFSGALGLEVKPFDRETYTLKDEGQDEAKRVLNPDQPVIRWRYRATDAGLVKESNARIVEWSNGSMQLLLGDNRYDIVEQDMPDQNNYLFVRTAAFIQAQARLTSRMVFRPKVLASGVQRRGGDKRARRGEKVQVVTTLVDPEFDKERREKLEEKRIRQQQSLRSKQNKTYRRSMAPLRTHNARMTTEFLEQGDEEDYEYYEDDMTATERARHELSSSRRNRYNEEQEAEAERRLTSAKRDGTGASRIGDKRSRLDVDEDEEDDAELSPDEPDDVPDEVDNKPKSRRGVIMSDDEDDF